LVIFFAAHCIQGDVKRVHTVRTASNICKNSLTGNTRNHKKKTFDWLLSNWWRHRRRLPDLRRTDDSSRFTQGRRASFGDTFAKFQILRPAMVLTSGAIPNEKITWGKLAVDTPRYVIESDATICAPLMFAYILGW